MKRIEVLDLCRSLCLILMVVWHGLYDLALFGRLDMAAMESLPAKAAAALCAGGFILISGICARLSRNNIRRGFTVFCAGAVLALVMALLRMPVAFGILQFFGLTMILYGLARERLDRLRSRAFPAACVLLFILSGALTALVTPPFDWLYPLGFKSESFYSADYYPLLPWVFLFLLGTWLGGRVQDRRDAPVFTRHWPRALTFPGRHSLAIYLLHQPVLYGLCRLIFG